MCKLFGATEFFPNSQFTIFIFCEIAFDFFSIGKPKFFVVVTMSSIMFVKQILAQCRLFVRKSYANKTVQHYHHFQVIVYLIIDNTYTYHCINIYIHIQAPSAAHLRNNEQRLSQLVTSQSLPTSSSSYDRAPIMSYRYNNNNTSFLEMFVKKKKKN